MPTSLYHATAYTDGLIQEIDESRFRPPDVQGGGFYTRPGEYVADRFLGGWRLNGDAGFVYRINIPETIDGSSGTDGKGRWLNGGGAVDQNLVDRLTASMRDVAKNAPSGKSFADAADQLDQAWKGGRLNQYNVNELIKYYVQSPLPSPTSSGTRSYVDVLRGAGIVGSYNSEAAVIYDPKAVEKPVPSEYRNPSNPDARNVGILFEELNKNPGLPNQTDRQLRIMIGEAAIATGKGDPAAYEKIRMVRGVLETSGVPMSPRLQKQLAMAENSTGKLAGLTLEQIESNRKVQSLPQSAAPSRPESVQPVSAAADSAEAELNRKAQALVQTRPPRIEGEGFEHYKDRVFEWYDHNNPKPTDAQNKAFNTALHDTLYREAQYKYANVTADAMAIQNNPDRLDRMLAGARSYYGGDRNFNTIGHVEDETGTYHSTPEFEAAKGSGRLKFKGGIALGVLGALAAGGAQAAQPGATPGKVMDSMINAGVPGYTAAKNGESCKSIAEYTAMVASGAAMVASVPPIAAAAVTVTAGSGLAAPIVGPLTAVAATGAVAAVGFATESAVAPAAESACNLVVKTFGDIKEGVLTLYDEMKRQQGASPSGVSQLAQQARQTPPGL